MLNDKDDVASVVVHGDGISVCNAASLSRGVLLLIALYFTINLDYPDEYAQLLGFIQLLCSDIDFPPSLRSSAFTELKESLL